MKTRKIALFVELEHTVRREVVRSIISHAGGLAAWDFDLQTSWNTRESDWDGVFAWPNHAADLTFLRSLKVPVVCLGSSATPGLSRVGFDNHQAGEMAAAHLIERGLLRLGVLIGAPGAPHSEARREGFERAARRRKIPCLILPTDRKDCIRELKKWTTPGQPPAGLLADTDLTGHGVLRLARELGLRVPEQLAVISVGADDLLCAISSPTLSSVVLPGSQMGAAAVRLMMARLSRNSRPPVTRLIKPELISAKESSDIFAISDPMVVRTLRFISERAAQPLSVSDILREIPLSRRLLEIRFKQAVGRTLQKHIWKAHLDRARHLLVSTALPMPDIADQSGFRDAQRLSEVFRRELGESPSAYRARHRTS